MHQPLPFHDKARGAAEAAQAAHAQGKFWAMHDKLFENNKALDRPDLDRYAKEIGLDQARFKADMDGHKHKEQIDADATLANKSGAGGTPTFFINGRQLVGAQPTEAFTKLIDEEIRHADELLKKGIKPEQLYDEILKTLPVAPPTAAAPPPGTEKVDLKPPPDAPFKGPATAAVTMVVFSDFQ
jgi:protein-disulfide isomerase